MRSPTDEDYCITQQVFQRWCRGLPSAFPLPLVDAWASSAQHVLPVFGTDYFNTVYPADCPLWINPRFSQLSAVLHHIRTQHQHAYVLFPHWPGSAWWDEMWSSLTHQWTFPHGMMAFLGLHQSDDTGLPCPWPFSIAFVDFRVHSVPQFSPPPSRYWKLVAGAGYPPIVPGYGALVLPKPYRKSVPSQPGRQITTIAPVSSTTLDYTALVALAHSLHFPKNSHLEAHDQHFAPPHCVSRHTHSQAFATWAWPTIPHVRGLPAASSVL